MATPEARLQGQIIRWLKSKGFYVIKTTASPGIPVGCPDVIGLLEGLWIALEVKSSKLARFQPLQKETLKKLDGWSYAKAVYPENWAEVQDEIEAMI